MPTRLMNASLARRALAALLLSTGLLGLLAAPKDDNTPAAVVTTLKGHGEAVYAVAYNPDGKFIVTASFDRTLKVFDAKSGKEFKTFGGQQGHQNLVVSVALSPDGTLIASGSADNTAKVWDFPSSNALRSLAHGAAVQAVAISPDGTRLAGAGKNGVVKIWDTKDGKELYTLKGHDGAVTGVSFSGNGQVLAT